MEHVFEEKDLDIIIDTHLTFDVHVPEKIKKVGLIRRSFSCLNVDILLPSRVWSASMEWTPEGVTNQDDTDASHRDDRGHELHRI